MSLWCSSCPHLRFSCSFFFFNDTATTEIYTLSLHDALSDLGTPGPDTPAARPCCADRRTGRLAARCARGPSCSDRKSTRLNSSHLVSSYAVFCLKKKKRVPRYSHLILADVRQTLALHPRAMR